MAIQLLLRHRFTVLLALATVFALAVLFLPGLLNPLPFCSLQQAGAQDNPCVAQEATIQALKGVLLQATLDHKINEATLTVLQNAVSSKGIATAGPAVGIPFKEMFADNKAGWDTTTHPEGKATIKDGKLIGEMHYNQYLIWYIPNLTVGDNFYAQMKVTDNCKCPGNGGIFYGFAIGDGTKQKSVSFLVHDNGGDSQQVQFYDQAKSAYLVNSAHKNLFPADQPVTLALEGKGNVFTLFVNGQEADAFRVNPYGRQLGLYLYNGNGAKDGSVSFTELSVTDKK